MKAKRQNPIAVALRKRHAQSTTRMRHRADRRAQDAGRSWRAEVH